MFRKLLVTLAALAASACSYGSMVDMAPMNARLSKPVAMPGDYCEVEGAKAPFTIVSHEDCVPVRWDQATRTYTMIDPDQPKDQVQTAIVSLGSSLYLAQIETPEDKERYQLHLLLAKGGAFAMLGALDDEPLKKLAAKHKKLTFENDPRGRPFIAAGKPDDIRNFLKEAARESLREGKAEAARQSEPDETVSIGVLDKAGAADHPASKQQTKDIEAVLQAAKSMTPR